MIVYWLVLYGECDYNVQGKMSIKIYYTCQGTIDNTNWSNRIGLAFNNIK